MSAEPEPAAELSAIESNGKGLRVRFYRQQDRYRHVVEAVLGEQVTPLIESVEGDSDQDWPPSPAFQELQRRSCDAGEPIILLTGAAGRSHWSLSLDVKQERLPKSVLAKAGVSDVDNIQLSQLEFDVACRLNDRPLWLGGCYRNFADCKFIFTPDCAIGAAIGLQCFLVIASVVDTRVEETFYLKEHAICVRPPGLPPDILPTTKRWAYRMVLLAV